MNQTQIKYARERATAIRNRREAALRESLTKLSVPLDCDEKLKALKAGRFTIGKVPRHSSWYSAVKFTDEVKGGLDQKAFDKAKATLDADYTKLIDELVLGDNEAALKMLEAFDA